MFYNNILSLLDEAPPRSLVHSFLNGYARLGSGELSGPFFVKALEPLGHRPSTVRRTLHRMVETQELVSERRGRETFHRLGPFSLAVSASAERRIFGGAESGWDGHWTVATYQFAAGEREARDHVRVALELAGFASAARGVFLHPRDLGRQVLEALRVLGLERQLLVVRGEYQGLVSDRELVGRLWDLDAIARGFETHLQIFEPLLADLEAWSPAEAFAVSTACVISFLPLATASPELPSELLPDDWPESRARQLTVSILMDTAERMQQHGDALSN